MKKQRDYSVLLKRHTVIRYIAPILISVVLLVIVLVVLLMNTVDMNRQLQENTKRYADDVSVQLASNISSRMNMRETYMRNLADTFSRMPKAILTEDLLERKAEYLEMDAIFLLNTDGSTFPADEEDLHPELEHYLSEYPDMTQEARIFYSSHQEIFFSVPIFWKDNGATSVLVGVRSNETLQNMLVDVDFRDQGLSCIVDSDGTVVVSATDEVPFAALKDIFHSDSIGEEAVTQRQVLKDIEERRSGVVQFENIGDEPLIFCYDFLGINDWVLLTLLPSNLFSEKMEQYLLQYMVILGLLAFVVLIIFICIVWSYRRSFRAIQNAALTDLLTGGKNRTFFQIEAENLLQKNAWQNLAIVYMNIRGFKRINEKFGSEMGNTILRQIYSILHSSLRESELICRTAGDHFFLLLKCDSEEEILHRAADMFGRLDEQLPRSVLIASSSIAVGAYLIKQQGKDFTVLIDWAKRAGDQAQTGECLICNEMFENQFAREYMLEDSFQHAIESREFQLYIQPKVSPCQKEASGGEVLVRWQHPTFGLLFPGDFIPLFERSGKICDLDFYMFEETCKLMQSWLTQGRALPLSVNISRAHLISNDFSFLDRFKAIKEQYEIPDGLIELELTESLMVERQDLRMAMTMIDRIRNMGFLCSIDDFGFGYSSLALLKDLNVTTVKLDRQFFLDESEKSWLVIEQLIQLAHSLDMTVVAEGIEKQEQVEQLRARGCDLVQGFVYAKPMPAADFKEWSSEQ